jgi:uncharacterized protein YndB with AHSA1/START domain
VSHDLRVERWFDATPEDVFDAYTDPDAQKEWYPDEPDWTVEAECDLRIGGVWNVAWGPPGSEPYRERNVFKEIDRPRRLVYTSTVTMEDGSSFDTAMEVTFEELGGRTRLTIVHTGFPTAHLRDEHRRGWPGFLDRLEEVVTSRAASR